MARLLDSINSPADLKKLSVKKLPKLAKEIRQEIIEVVCKHGGHLASSLGAVELTIALHYVLNTPEDVIVWDVGHQSYAHKLLTGRRERFKTLRQLGGLSGFPNKEESVYDPFTVGHASTSISTALGMVSARDLLGRRNKVVVLIGDASLGGGMAFEGLNFGGQLKKDIVVILNDNELSISPTIGALSIYLNRILTNPLYNRIRKDVENLLKRVPLLGFKAYRAARRFEEGLKNLLVPGILFEEMGFRYFGPIDGHNITAMINTFRNILSLDGPILVHLVTKKGMGYRFAEECPSAFHSAVPFDVKTGKRRVNLNGEIQFERGKSFTKAFGEHIIELAKHNNKIVAITAAMPDGTGLTEFSKVFPERFFDVGIAEQHAVGFAAGLANYGFKPICAIYSTFLQRAYDQIVHDVCLQNLGVVFCLDRAGLVGEDGPTHHGLFDISYLRHIPRLVFMAPCNTDELKLMLEFAIDYPGPIAIRYPKGSESIFVKIDTRKPISLGRSQILKEGKDLVIFAIGSMVPVGMAAAQLLQTEGIDAAVVNVRFIKPLDEDTIRRFISVTNIFVTLEEGVVDGGFGSGLLEFLEKEGKTGIFVKRLGLPCEFIEHGSRDLLLRKYGLSPEGVVGAVKGTFLWQRSR